MVPAQMSGGPRSNKYTRAIRKTFGMNLVTLLCSLGLTNPPLATCLTKLTHFISKENFFDLTDHASLTSCDIFDNNKVKVGVVVWQLSVQEPLLKGRAQYS